MKIQQASNDERDNRRVFVWGIVAALIVMLGALAYLFAADQMAERPVRPTPTQSTSQTVPSTAPAK